MTRQEAHRIIDKADAAMQDIRSAVFGREADGKSQQWMAEQHARYKALHAEREAARQHISHTDALHAA